MTPPPCLQIGNVVHLTPPTSEQLEAHVQAAFGPDTLALVAARRQAFLAVLAAHGRPSDRLGWSENFGLRITDYIPELRDLRPFRRHGSVALGKTGWRVQGQPIYRYGSGSTQSWLLEPLPEQPIVISVSAHTDQHAARRPLICRDIAAAILQVPADLPADAAQAGLLTGLAELLHVLQPTSEGLDQNQLVAELTARSAASAGTPQMLWQELERAIRTRPGWFCLTFATVDGTEAGAPCLDWAEYL